MKWAGMVRWIIFAAAYLVVLAGSFWLAVLCESWLGNWSLPAALVLFWLLTWLLFEISDGWLHPAPKRRLRPPDDAGR